jgi:hypothetical protein
MKAFVFSLLLALVACAETPEEQFARLRNETPSVTGGFTYKQYVVVNPGDPEVLGDEGVLYISPLMFTDEQLKQIGQTEAGKTALESASYSPADGLLNMCFSAQPRDKGKAGHAGGYSKFVITWAHHMKEGGVGFTLYSWPDAWYTWDLKKTGTQVVAEDPSVQHDFGWQSSRIALTPDPSVDLEKCLNYLGGS